MNRRDWSMRVFELSWRLSLLSLPWQTRVFDPALLGGWPWEQGTLSFYGSWIPLLLTIVLGFWVHPVSLRTLPWKRILLVGTLCAGWTFVVTRGSPLGLRAGVQWWGQVFLLGLGGWTLLRAHVSARALVGVTVLAMLPHLLLGIVQFHTQTVLGSSWAGIASQDVERPGVSVVEVGGTRVLRAYGGFPHPNIFGGWLAFVVWWGLWLAMTSLTYRGRIAWSLISASFAGGLVLTFSRGAWIAATGGMIVLCILLWRERRVNWKSVFLPISLVLFTALLVGGLTKPLISERTNRTSRLERQSISARRESLQDGIRLWREHPWWGTGPNAELISRVPVSGVAPIPLEPPHNLYLLLLVNTGVVGILGIGLVLWKTRRWWKRAIPWLTVGLLIGLTDYYLWAYWPGQVLLWELLILTASHLDAKRRLSV